MASSWQSTDESTDESTGQSTEQDASRSPTEQGAAVSIACPSCHQLVAADAPCPHCGSLPDSAAPQPAEPTVVLPPVPDRTAELAIPVDAPEPGTWVAPPAWPPSGPPVDREPPPVLFTQAPEPPPVLFTQAPEQPLLMPVAEPNAEASRTRRVAGVLAGAAALVLVGAAAIAGLRSGGGSENPSRSASGGTPAASATVRVSPAGVRVSASSTQHPDGGVSYAAANTLDGDPETAWNSHGQGAGASLTYTFSAPVDLQSITVSNGYQKVLTRSDGSRVDLYLLNERVRTVKVVTAAGSVTWTLRDDRAPQTLGHAFGSTRSVRLQVLSVYPSQKYKDLAVSDVAFGASH